VTTPTQHRILFRSA